MSTTPSPSKLCFVDVETTGLNPETHGIWQIALIVEIAGAIAIRQSWRCQPFKGRDKVNDEALAVGHVTLADLKTFPEPGEVKTEIESLLEPLVAKRDKADKMHFIGYNARFDYDFLRAWWTKNGDAYFGSWFWMPPIDVMSLAGLYCMDVRPQLVNFKLPTIAKQLLNRDPDDTQEHDALYDIELTRELFHHMRGQAIAAWKERL